MGCYFFLSWLLWASDSLFLLLGPNGLFKLFIVNFLWPSSLGFSFHWAFHKWPSTIVCTNLIEIFIFFAEYNKPGKKKTIREFLKWGWKCGEGISCSWVQMYFSSLCLLLSMVAPKLVSLRWKVEFGFLILWVLIFQILVYVNRQ